MTARCWGSPRSAGSGTRRTACPRKEKSCRFPTSPRLRASSSTATCPPNSGRFRLPGLPPRGTLGDAVEVADLIARQLPPLARCRPLELQRPECDALETLNVETKPGEHLAD